VAEYDDFDVDDPYERPPDPQQVSARETLAAFFEEHREQVFFSRQIEVRNEDRYFHWVTNRALRELVEEGILRSETRTLSSGGSIKLMWHRGYRFYKRSATRLIAVVEEYANPNIGAALGLHGESMVLEGFARSEFVMRGRNTQGYRDRKWQESDHNLDFLFERDSVVYGIEVKNTLGYMEYEEFQTKIRLCEFLGVRPIFAARMLPRSWIKELVDSGGYAMILKGFVA
jgi:hypothetical protein